MHAYHPSHTILVRKMGTQNARATFFNHFLTDCNVIPTLAGRAADPLWPHPCNDDRKVSRGLIDIIKQSLLEIASGVVLIIPVAGSKD
jgi:hypothetical protein